MSREELIAKQLQGVSTADFLGTLDYGQLVRAQELVDSLITRKDSEEWVPIWVVGTEYGNVAAFREDGYQEAVARARRLLDEEAESGGSFVVQVEKEKRRESEVAEMLALNI